MNIYNSLKQYVVMNRKRLPRIPNAVYRLYNPNADNMHHWTANYEEANKLYGFYGWEYEGIGWYQGKGEAVPRYYNPNNGDHMYTLDQNEAQTLYSLGWNSEGVDFKNDDDHRIPVYRLYFRSTGQHMFTIENKEVKDLMSRGWEFEGIAFYGTSKLAILSKTKMRALSGFSSIISIVRDHASPSNAVDISVDGDGSITGYVDGNRVLHLWTNAKKIAPNDCNEMFDNCRYLSSIDGLRDWDVSNVTSMRGMFRYCYALTNVNALSSWKTSSLTELGGSVDGYYGMFSGCTSLTNIDGLRNWDVSNVVTMNCLFESCPISDIAPVSGWKTSSLVNANDVFNRTNITNVDALNNWDVSKTKILSEMFRGCTRITSLSGINGWNVDPSADMQRMFYDIPKSVNRPSWAASNAQ